MIARGGEDDAAVIRRELKIQLQSEADWKGYNANILSSLELQIFGYMVVKSPFINTLHSCAHYSGFGGRSDLVGNALGILTITAVFQSCSFCLKKCHGNGPL